jgi:uncharacterized alkaline shock family protein YloU
VIGGKLKGQSINTESSSDYHRSIGKTTIAPEVLLTIARLATLDVPGVSRMGNMPGNANRLFSRSSGEGVHIEIKDDIVSADLYVILKNDINIRDVSRNIQYDVARAISEMVGMPVDRVNIHIEDIDYLSETDQGNPQEA